MDTLKSLEKKLEKAGKFDKLAVYCEILALKCEKQDKKIIITYKQALAAYQDYLDYDPQAPASLRGYMTEVFFHTFKAIRNYLGGKDFARVYEAYTRLEPQLSPGDILAQIYADLSFIFWAQNLWDTALEYGLKSLKQAELSLDRDILPGRYSNIGFVYESKGDYTNAELYYERGLDYGFRMNSDHILSLAHCGLGRARLAAGNHRAATTNFLEALKCLNDEKGEDYLIICFNLGAAYGKSGDYQESLKYFQIINDNTDKHSNPEMYYSTLMNTANCYMYLGDNRQAEQNYLEIIASDPEHNDLQTLSGAMLNLARIKSQESKQAEALEIYLGSKIHIAQTGNKYQDVVADFGLGTVYAELGENERAISYFKTALQNAQELNLSFEIMSSHRSLSRIYESINQPEKALMHYKEYHACEMESKDAKVNLDMKSIKNQYQKKDRAQSMETLYADHSMMSRELAALVKTPFIGTSRALREVFSKALLCAQESAAPVLITGESGTGKEIVSRIVHYASSRKIHPYTAVNSVAFSDSLIESTFFGSEKGSFTGSTQSKNGYFEITQFGTLFLDEISEMSLSMQSKLLRVLEEHVINRVGGTKDIPIDFRLISATNKDLDDLSAQNLFRFDLLNRINTLRINIPPLREHSEDIPLLVKHFISLYRPQSGSESVAISKAAMDLLCNYHYPGNVRELRNIIQRSVLVCNKNVLEPEDIVIGEQRAETKANSGPLGDSLNLEDWENHLIKKAMLASNNVQAKAAIMLGISPFALNRRLRKE